MTSNDRQESIEKLRNLIIDKINAGEIDPSIGKN